MKSSTPALCFVAVLFFSSCQREITQRLDSASDTYSDSLTILDFFPRMVKVGDSVLIAGKRFDPSLNGNVVTVNSLQQVMFQASDTLLVVRIVPGTTSGRITVKARNQQAISSDTLIIAAYTQTQPIILSFSPDSVQIGDTVLIEGKGFSPILSDNIVTVNTTLAEVLQATDSTLLIKVSGGTTTGKITVTVNAQRTTSSRELVIVSSVQTPLSISSFVPDFAKIGDTVTINGTGFSPVVMENSVTINNTAAQVISASSKVLVVKVLAGTTTGKISVMVNGKTASSFNDLFIVTAGGPWVRKADFPGMWSGFPAGDYTGVTGISVGENGYFLKSGQLWEYSPSQNIWTRKKGSSMDIYCFAFSIGKKIYVGYSGKGYVPDSVNLLEYDLLTDSWTKKRNLPIQPRIAPFGFAVNGVGYVGGGQISFDAANMNAHDFWKYDALNDTWSRLADFPGPWTIGISGLAIGNEGYVYDAGLGYPQAPIFASGKGRLWKYDVNSNTWIEKATNPGGNGAMSAATFAIGNKGYVALSIYNGATSPKNDFWMYDPSTNTWTKRADVGGGLRWFGSGFSIGNKGYVGLGTGNTIYQQKKDFWEYTPE